MSVDIKKLTSMLFPSSDDTAGCYLLQVPVFLLICHPLLPSSDLPLLLAFNNKLVSNIYIYTI